MAVTVCPKCCFEFLAAGASGEPEKCPSCGHSFEPGAGATAIKPGGALLVTIGIVLGLAIDVLLSVGSVAGAVEAGLFDARKPHPPVAPLVVLLLGLAGHAGLSLFAIGRIAHFPHSAVLLGRLAVGCWLVLGGAAVFMGAQLWPARLSSRPDWLIALCLLLLGALLTYLGGLEWLSQKVSAKPGAKK